MKKLHHGYKTLITRGNRFWIEYRSGLIYPISKKRFYQIVIDYPELHIINKNRKNKYSPLLILFLLLLPNFTFAQTGLNTTINNYEFYINDNLNSGNTLFLVPPSDTHIVEFKYNFHNGTGATIYSQIVLDLWDFTACLGVEQTDAGITEFESSAVDLDDTGYFNNTIHYIRVVYSSSNSVNGNNCLDSSPTEYYLYESPFNNQEEGIMILENISSSTTSSQSFMIENIEFILYPQYVIIFILTVNLVCWILLRNK